MRIVTLLPSATEIVFSLGLEDALVGVTHECDHPAAARELPAVTRTLIPDGATSGEIDVLVGERLSTDAALYRLDVPALHDLRPDLIVTQTLCAVCAVAADEVRDAACALPGSPRVLNLEPETLDGVFGAIDAVGDATGRSPRAAEVVAGLRKRVEAVTVRSAGIPRSAWPRVAFLEWIDPPFCGGHWNPELVTRAGGIDVLGVPTEASRRLTWDEIADAAPDVLFVACCGYPTERTLTDVPLMRAAPGWDGLPAARSGRVYVTDGNAYFSRPGPRLVESLEILAHALHPDVHPEPTDPARRV